MDIGIVLFFGILLFFSLALDIVAYTTHRGSIAFVAALAWLATGIWAMAEAGGIWNTYMIFFWISFIMAITSILEAMFLNKGEEQAEDEIQYTTAIDEAYADMDDRLKKLHERRVNSAEIMRRNRIR